MNEDTRQSIELEARRVFSSEAAAYREHLEKQFGQLKWAVGIIAGFAAAAFIYAFGKTYSEFGKTTLEVMTEARKRLDDINLYAQSQVTERVIDFKVRNNAQERLAAIVNMELDSQQTLDRIRNKIDGRINQAVSEQIENRISVAILAKADELNVQDFTRNLLGVPIGTVISSILPPSLLSSVVGDPAQFDVMRSIWILADGRDVRSSRYANLTGESKVPDLRGVFLRGLNAGRTDGFQDPDHREVGSFQADEIVRHNHRPAAPGAPSGGGFVVQSGNRSAFLQGNGGSMQLKDTTDENDGGPETRPKNVAVYHFIKIN